MLQDRSMMSATVFGKFEPMITSEGRKAALTKTRYIAKPSVSFRMSMLISDYSDDMDPEEKIGSRSPTSNAVAAIEAYASGHLPRLVEEVLETAVAQQTQPIEEGLRRALPDICWNTEYD